MTEPGLTARAVAWRTGLVLRNFCLSLGWTVKLFIAFMMVATLAQGLRIPLGEGYRDIEADPALHGLFRDELRRARLRTEGPAFLALEVLPGYNCRAFIWIGAARVSTVWDTGSSRNSIDKEYLKALATNKRTQKSILDVKKIEPITCRSVDGGHSRTRTKDPPWRRLS